MNLAAISRARLMASSISTSCGDVPEGTGGFAAGALVEGQSDVPPGLATLTCCWEANMTGCPELKIGR